MILDGIVCYLFGGRIKEPMTEEQSFIVSFANSRVIDSIIDINVPRGIKNRNSDLISRALVVAKATNIDPSSLGNVLYIKTAKGAFIFDSVLDLRFI
jgi:predicted RNase H-like nuclease